jgi:hypothetical protein
MPDTVSRRSVAACADPTVPTIVMANTIAAVGQIWRSVVLRKFIIATAL